MVQSCSFLLLLALSAVMIHGAPLAVRSSSSSSKHDHNKGTGDDDNTTSKSQGDEVVSKLQEGFFGANGGQSNSAQFGQQGVGASCPGATGGNTGSTPLGQMGPAEAALAAGAAVTRINGENGIDLGPNSGTGSPPLSQQSRPPCQGGIERFCD